LIFLSHKTGDELQNYIDGAKKGAFKQHIWGLYVLSVWLKKNIL